MDGDGAIDEALVPGADVGVGAVTPGSGALLGAAVVGNRSWC